MSEYLGNAYGQETPVDLCRDSRIVRTQQYVIR